MASASSAPVAGTSVSVHPLVLLSVADHAARSVKGTKKRAVGILLGQDNGKVINVANSFAVPFEEDERDPRTWFLDHNYVEAMDAMFRKVNARERLIGWYHTGPKLRSSDLEINEVIKRYCPKPLMVIVDVRNREVGLPTDAYFAVEEIKDDGTERQKTFMHVPSGIEAEEAEEIGVEHLLRDIKDLSTGTLGTRVADQLASLRGLQDRLTEIADYLGQVVKGELPINHQVIYHLQDVFNLLPNLAQADSSDPGASKPFTIATNDQLLVMYLSSMIRAVIALHNLVLNKISLKAEDAPPKSKPKAEDKDAAAKADGADGAAKPAGPSSSGDKPTSK